MDALQNAFSKKERNSEAMQSFGFRLRNQFFQNKSYRRAKELEWLESLRQYKGLWDPGVKIEENASRVYPKITRSKVNIVLSRLHELLFPELDKNWELGPTPEPKVSKEIVTKIVTALIESDPQTGEQKLPSIEDLRLAIKDYAKATSERMSSVIDDQLTEMDYPEETKKVLRSGLMYGTGIMKGPLVGKRTKRRWVPAKTGTDYEEFTDEEDVPDLQFTRIWDWYPDMSVTDIEQSEGSFERHIMNKHDLRKLMKRDDFYPEMIEQFLKDYPDGNYTPENWETELQTIEIEAGSGKGEVGFSTVAGSSSDRNAASNRQMGRKYEVLEFWGYIDGNDLSACGLDIPDVTLEYAGNIWLLGDRPIKALLFPTALDQYKVFYYEKDETSIFGEGLAKIMRHSQLSIAASARMVLDNAACVTGDTEVYRNQSSHDPFSKRPAIITLKELWETKHKHNSGLRRMKIRSVDEPTGEIFYNRVVDVFNNGMKDVFECKTLHGYHIKATDDHRFMRDDGEWQEFREFCLGDMIAVNGRVDALLKICIECGAELSKEGALRCRSCASKIENSPWNRKQAEEAATSTDASFSSARQRWACQKDKKDVCERCGAKMDAGVKLDVHHKDGNPYNNEPENKLTLCHPCHMWLHNRHDYFGQPFQHRYVDYDEIVSIEYIGEEEVFDLQLEAPNHNFIANGFVAHNCVAGPQVEVNWSLMTEDTDLSSFYPRKIWYREGKGIDAQYPALRVYNIDSHVDELLKIIDAFKQFGDEETTLPTWMIGQMVNNETAQATSGRMATITVSIKDVVKNFDAFTEKVMRDLYAWNMEFNPRQDIKGDYQCKARGVSSLVMKEVRMQALNQLATTLTDQERDYIPTRELLSERFKAHDIAINLLTEEEVQKIHDARDQSIQNKLQIEMLQSEIAKNKAQSMSLLTKSKKTNVEAIKDAQAPPEGVEQTDPRLIEGDVALKQTDVVAKEAEIRRKEEQHSLNMQHQQEKHGVQIATDTTKAAQKMAIEGKQAEHGMEMKTQMTKAGVMAKKIAAKKKPAPAKPAKTTK